MEGGRWKQWVITQKNNENLVCFSGAKLNKHQANQTGFALIAGIIGMILAYLIFGQDQKSYGFILVGLFFGLGFFGYGVVRQNEKIKKK